MNDLGYERNKSVIPHTNRLLFLENDLSTNFDVDC